MRRFVMWLVCKLWYGGHDSTHALWYAEGGYCTRCGNLAWPRR